MEEPIYIDEDGKRVASSDVGKTHEIVNAASSGTQKTNASLVYNRLMQEEKVNNFISQTSPTQSLTAINYMLRGYAYNEENKEWGKVADGVPDKVRLDFLQFITPDLSEDVRMTNLSSQQINGIMESTIEWVYDYLKFVRRGIIKNKKETIDDKQIPQITISCRIKYNAGYTIYEISQLENVSEEKINEFIKLKTKIKIEYEIEPIKDYNQLQKISLIMIKAVFYTLLRATNGIERSQMFKSLSMGETLNPSQQAPKKSLFNFWGK